MMGQLARWRWAVCVVRGLLGAVLFWLCFFPANFGWLAFVALVPWLELARAPVRARVRYLSAWLGGFAFFLLSVSWMRVADETMIVGWWAASAYLSLYVPLAVWAVRRLDRFGLPMALTAPLAWVAWEMVRGLLMGGFPWYFAGHTQHDFPWMIQSADLTGVAAVSFVVVAVNGLVVDWLYPATGRRWLGLTAVGLLVAANLGYGAWRSSQTKFATGPKVAAIQTLTPQSARNSLDNDELRSIWEEAVRLADRAAAMKPDLIVWPETSFPWIVPLADDAASPARFSEQERQMFDEAKKDVSQSAVRTGTTTLWGTGVEVFKPGGASRRYNAALFIDARGQIIGRYDKIHRVPFGEFVPLVETFPWLKNFTPYDGVDYSIAAGEVQTRLPLRKGKRDYRFGVLICYEDSDADLARGYFDGGRDVDFLVNISNDGWFKGTSEHEQHLVACRFRAVECRRAVIRAVNHGISAVIDPNGRVTHLPAATWAESKRVAGVVVADLPIDRRRSMYLWAGDWLGWACVGLTAVGCLWRRRPRG